MYSMQPLISTTLRLRALSLVPQGGSITQCEQLSNLASVPKPFISYSC